MAKGAVVARILTQYSDKGTKAAVKDVAKMKEKFGDFANKAMKAFGLAAAAAGALAVKVGTDAVRAAMEDQKSQAMLANSLRGTVGATNEAIAATEEWISKQQLALGVADDELRPSLGRLAAVTGDITQAQKLLGIALDVSAAKNIDLESASAMLAKAYGGNLTALKKQFPQISAATVKSKDFAAALREIGSEIQGAALTRANTFAGQVERIKIAFGEASESLGYKLLPMVQQFADLIIKKAIPAIQKFVDENGDRIASAFKTGISYGIAFAKFMFDMFSFVARNIKVFATLGAVIIAAFVGAKVAAATQALIGGIMAIIKVMKALRGVSLATAAATALATGGVSAATGAVAFGAALLGVGLAVKKFSNDTDEAGKDIGKFTMQTDKFATKTEDYTKGITGMTVATNKLTAAQKKQTAVDAKVQEMKDKIFKKYGINVQTNDLNTLGAIWNNLNGTNFGISSPTISLAASAGKNGTIGSNTSVNGGNVTVNVAGSVVSDQDLVIAVQNGLETLARRNGAGASGLRVSQQVA